MTNEEDLAAVARAIIDANLYMVLGTADKTGRPWVSPVYYAAEGYTELYWVSSPEARHSRNLATRPELSIVVFDSQAPIGTGQGVYMAGVADEPTAGDLERGITVYSRSSVAHGALEWKAEDVVAPALYRLYRATVSEHFVLAADRPDHRTPVNL